MATRTASIEEIKKFGEYAHIISWTGLLNGDNGEAIEMPGSHIRSIHFTGTFSVGGTIVLEGSNDGVTFVTLTDPQANNISKTAEAIEQVQELTRYVRPRVTGGDGSTNLKAYLMVKRIH